MSRRNRVNGAELMGAPSAYKRSGLNQGRFRYDDSLLATMRFGNGAKRGVPNKKAMLKPGTWTPGGNTPARQEPHTLARNANGNVYDPVGTFATPHVKHREVKELPSNVRQGKAGETCFHCGHSLEGCDSKPHHQGGDNFACGVRHGQERTHDGLCPDDGRSKNYFGNGVAPHKKRGRA